MTTLHYEVIDPWLELLWEHGGTDLQITAGSPPRLRVDGRLAPIANIGSLSGESIDHLIGTLLSPELLEAFKAEKDVDFAFSWHDRARIRGNAFMQRGEPAVALRMIPARIPTFQELGLPDLCNWLAHLPRGMVLVTGPTGSGKSTTLASIIDYINHTRELHVLTLEDPIEYVHQHGKSIVNQREIGVDSDSFARALRSALREDPDVLLVGEMRDLESIQIALTMAETGHLVFATLHTNDAATALDRIVDVFPAERRDQIRVQLAGSLSAVVAQRLVPRVDRGMVAVFEVLIGTPASCNLIREGKTNQLRNVMTTGQQDRMVTLEQSLARLVHAGYIAYETALASTVYPKDFTRALAALGTMQPAMQPASATR